MRQVDRDWQRVQTKRQRVRDAKNIRERLDALFVYQGELHIFVERHRDLIELTLAMTKLVEGKAP